jgi:hypothetical protein
VQPIDFQDGAFYSVLAVDLQKTGIESTLAPSGLTPPRGSPEQNWYHWGEIWIASAVGDLVDVDPISARHFIVLPALLLAAAALTGTLVRRANRTESRKAFLLGFAACLFLAPIPVLDGGFFNKWAVGLTFGITQFGLGAIVVLLSMYAIVTARTHSDSWRFATYSGSLMAMIVPAHIVIAALSVSTACGLLALRLIRRLLGHRSLAIIPPPWQRTAICTSVIVGATIVWGVATGHGLGGTAVSDNVRSFNFAWAQSLLAVIVGGGILLSIPIAWLFAQVESPAADGYAAIGGTIVLGAIVWGARLGDFNMFYVFFAAVTVFGVPAAAIGIWSLVSRSRRARFTRVALLLSIIAVLQVEVGIGTVVLRLQQFGAGRYDPVPVQVLAAIRELPPPAKVAYRCANNEEISYWVPRLLAIGVRGDHPIIPLCFETDSFSELTGGTRDPATASPLFLSAPQLDLFPSPSANPRPDDVAAWMRAQGIEYIYADLRHPNTLVPEAHVVTQVGDFALFELP